MLAALAASAAGGDGKGHTLLPSAAVPETGPMWMAAGRTANHASQKASRTHARTKQARRLASSFRMGSAEKCSQGLAVSTLYRIATAWHLQPIPGPAGSGIWACFPLSVVSKRWV